MNSTHGELLPHNRVGVFLKLDGRVNYVDGIRSKSEGSGEPCIVELLFKICAIHEYRKHNIKVLVNQGVTVP